MKTVYQTDDKQIFESEQEAIIHEAVKSIEGIYIEEYKMKHLVKGLAANLFVVRYSLHGIRELINSSGESYVA